MSDKTTINNWTGGATLQTWPDGEWQILYAKDSAGSCVTLSLTSQDAIRLAYAVSPIPNEQFERLRAANEAVYELSYPEARSDELRQIADEIDCGGGCEGCSQQKLDRGEFCGFVAADNLRKLAAALDLKAALSHQPAPVAANASAGPDWKLSDDTKARIAEIDDNLRNAALNAANVVAANTSAELQNDLGEMLRALGMSDAAQPKSPHEVFQSAIAEMKRQIVNASAEARLREALDKRRYIATAPHSGGWRLLMGFATLAEVQAASEALSAHPHASDCDKHGCMGDMAPGDPKDLAELLTKPSVLEPSDRTADVKCEACSGTGRHMGRFSMNDPDCTYCNGRGKVRASDCDKQGWLAKDVEAATKRVAAWKNEATKSEGISLSDLPTGGSHSGIGFGHKTFVRKLVDDPNSASGKSLRDVEVLPSDRTADVTVEDIALVLLDGWKAGKAPIQIARDVRRAFTVGMR